jgi:hypothetical protein
MADRSVRVRLEAITHQYDRRISESAVLTRKFSAELESADHRMSNIVQTGLALAPALAPIGAAGIPALAGLTAQAGFAALGIGTLVLGLHGVGDALDALNKFQLKPTADNFAKLRAEVDKLGPAGADFVFFLDDLQPRLHRLQALAEQGLLPGVEDSLKSLLHLIPQVRELVFGVSSTLGDLIRDAGDNLDDPRWQRFFGFLQTRARPTLTEMGQTAGNFAEAFANLVVTFDPLERDFSRGLLHMSQQVKDWSDGLEQSQGFQDLVDYVRANGPRALDTLSALGDALIQIVQAAAPVGSVALPILTDLLKIVGAVADTPVIGSSLVGLAAAIGIYGRSLALLKTVGLRGNEGVLASTFSGAKTSIRDAAGALIEVTTAQDRARLSATELMAVEERRAATIRGGLGTIGKGAALATGFAVAQTGAADAIGLTNTASLALIGTIGGPWGAAIGGATGLVLDLTHANDGLEESIKQVNAAAKAGDFSAWRHDLQDLLDKNRQIQKDAEDTANLLHPVAFTKEGFGNLAQLFGHDPAGDAKKQAAEQAAAFDTVRKNAVDLFATLNGADPKGLKLTDDELTQFITKIAPALQRAGVDVNSLLQQQRPSWLNAQLAVSDWVNEMDSAKGRSQAVSDALATLEDQITPTVDAAKQLSDALDALFGPELSQADAIDQWIQGLHDLRKALDEGSNALLGNSEAALKHRAAIRRSVEELLTRVKTDAAAGVSADKIAATLRRGRDAIVEQAVAAGLSKSQVIDYLSSIGLSAKNLNTILENVRKHLSKLSDQLIALDNKTYTIKVKTVYDATHNNALGGIHAYAQGDVANRHMPELAGPGVTRVWREPETRGEAYIPLANDFRRPRAISIWEQTGQALGVQFRRYAFGGMSGAGASTLSIDYDRLARTLAGVRPVFGDVHVQPHNYSQFVRQMAEDVRLANAGGIPPPWGSSG